MAIRANSAIQSQYGGKEEVRNTQQAFNTLSLTGLDGKPLDGSQVWVRTYNSTVTNAGVNTTPRTFDLKTGLNNNPLK